MTPATPRPAAATPAVAFLAGLALLGSFAGPASAQEPPKAPAAPAPKPADVVLPVVVSPETLRAEVAAKPGSWTILDVRPAWQFAEFHVPGAVNVKPADVAAKIAALPAGAKVAIVDRDGTTAVAVAALARPADGSRTVVALSGGTRGWWRETNTSQASDTGRAKATTPAKPATDAPAPAAPKRPAGC